MTRRLPEGPNRARWSWLAAGALLAVASGSLLSGATASAVADDESTFVPIVPCRLFDTRPLPEFNLGPRSTPLGEAEIYIQQVTGANGDCALPEGITAVSLNVTVVDPTAPSWLALWPADTDSTPNVSNLNYIPGTAPTPNKVDVAVSGDGQVKLMNRFGSAHVLADVNGYYTNAGLQQLTGDVSDLDGRVTVLENAPAPPGLESTLAALQQAVADLEGDVAALTAANADLEERVTQLETTVAEQNNTILVLSGGLGQLEIDLGLLGLDLGLLADTTNGLLGDLDILGLSVSDLLSAQPFAQSFVAGSVTVGGSDVTAASLEVTAPVAGTVTVTSSAATNLLGLVGTLTCQLVTDDPAHDGLLQRIGLLGATQLAGTAQFDVDAGDILTISLECNGLPLGLTANLTDVALNAIFTPTP